MDAGSPISDPDNNSCQPHEGDRKQGLTLPGSSATSSVNPNLFVDNSQIVEVVALLSWGRFSYARARPRSCVPHPPKMPDLGRGRHYPKHIVAVGGRKSVLRSKILTKQMFACSSPAGLAASIVTTDRTKKKGTGTMAGPPKACLAFRNNRWRRRRFALAVRCSVGLCRGRDAKESHRRCRQ